MAVVIPLKRPKHPLPPKKKRSSESILRDYARTMIAFRSICLEDENVDCATFWSSDVVHAIDVDLCLTDSQELRLARNVKAIHDGARHCPKLETIREVWRLYDDEAPPPSEGAIIAALKLAGARSENGIAKLIGHAKRNRAAYLKPDVYRIKKDKTELRGDNGKSGYGDLPRMRPWLLALYGRRVRRADRFL